MVDMYFSKKGVSPLIATVLLISFAVALGAVIMNWAGSLSGGRACHDLDIEIEEMCFDASAQQFKISVHAQVQGVDGMQIKLTGSADTLIVDMRKSVPEGSSQMFALIYDVAEYGELRQASVAPIIDVSGHAEVCHVKQVQQSTVKSC
jgi:flagellin-like protein